MTRRKLSNVVGFDDGPFDRDHRGDVAVVGAIYAGLRFDGVIRGKVRRDGANATERLASLVETSRFREHLNLILLKGIALAGFNVVDVPTLHERLGLPVLVLTRQEPDLDAIRDALLRHVPGGTRKWRLIQKMDPMEPLGDLWVQRAGLSRSDARHVIERFALHGHVPEPLRVAHMIAAAVVEGESRGRA